MGVGWELGFGWGAVVAGVGLVWWFVQFYDVDEKEVEVEQQEWSPYG